MSSVGNNVFYGAGYNYFDANQASSEIKNEPEVQNQSESKDAKEIEQVNSSTSFQGLCEFAKYDLRFQVYDPRLDAKIHEETNEQISIVNRIINKLASDVRD